MEFKGTNKPWQIVEGSNAITSQYQDICEVYDWSDPDSLEEGETKEEADLVYNANKLLISKAPEMLDMLKKVLEVHEHHGFNGHLINDQIKELIISATTI